MMNNIKWTKTVPDNMAVVGPPVPTPATEETAFRKSDISKNKDSSQLLHQISRFATPAAPSNGTNNAIIEDNHAASFWDDLARVRRDLSKKIATQEQLDTGQCDALNACRREISRLLALQNTRCSNIRNKPTTAGGGSIWEETREAEGNHDNSVTDNIHLGNANASSEVTGRSKNIIGHRVHENGQMMFSRSNVENSASESRSGYRVVENENREALPQLVKSSSQSREEHQPDALANIHAGTIGGSAEAGGLRGGQQADPDHSEDIRHREKQARHTSRNRAFTTVYYSRVGSRNLGNDRLTERIWTTRALTRRTTTGAISGSAVADVASRLSWFQMELRPSVERVIISDHSILSTRLGNYFSNSVWPLYASVLIACVGYTSGVLTQSRLSIEELAPDAPAGCKNVNFLGTCGPFLRALPYLIVALVGGALNCFLLLHRANYAIWVQQRFSFDMLMIASNCIRIFLAFASAALQCSDFEDMGFAVVCCGVMWATLALVFTLADAVRVSYTVKRFVAAVACFGFFFRGIQERVMKEEIFAEEVRMDMWMFSAPAREHSAGGYLILALYMARFFHSLTRKQNRGFAWLGCPMVLVYCDPTTGEELSDERMQKLLERSPTPITSAGPAVPTGTGPGGDGDIPRGEER